MDGEKTKSQESLEAAEKPRGLGPGCVLPVVLVELDFFPLPLVFEDTLALPLSASLWGLLCLGPEFTEESWLQAPGPLSIGAPSTPALSPRGLTGESWLLQPQGRPQHFRVGRSH